MGCGLLASPNVFKVAYYSFDGAAFSSFEKSSKLFFPSLSTACLSLLPSYMKFEQLNVNKCQNEQPSTQCETGH